jgi:hypothetical protein
MSLNCPSPIPTGISYKTHVGHYFNLKTAAVKYDITNVDGTRAACGQHRATIFRIAVLSDWLPHNSFVCILDYLVLEQYLFAVI